MRLAILIPLTVIPGAAVCVVAAYLLLRALFGEEHLP